jgi:hypothetical protein
MELLHKDSFACSLVNQYIGASSCKPVYNAVLKELVDHQRCTALWCSCYETAIRLNGEILLRSCKNTQTLIRHVQGKYEPVLEQYNHLMMSSGLGGIL